MPLLATVADCRTYLVVEHQDDDGLLALLLEGAEGRLQAYLGRALTGRQRTEYLDGGVRRLHVKHFPIQRRQASAAVQTLTPAGDAANPGGWVIGGTLAVTGQPLFQTVDEAVLEVNDYAESPAAPTAAQYVEFLLAAVGDPLSATGHTIRYTLAKSAAGGAQIDATVELIQGPAGVVVATWQHVNVSDTPASFAQVLTGTQADAILAYDDLRLRVSGVQVSGSPNRSLRVFWVSGDVPAPPPVVIYDTQATDDVTDEELVDGTLYRVEHETGGILRTAARVDAGVWDIGARRWKVVYIGGLDQDPDYYDLIRPELRQSVFDLVAELYEHRDPRLASGTSSGVAQALIAQAAGAALPPRVQAVWDAYAVQPRGAAPRTG